ncbi:hypothetical protein JOB18_024745 [Solea senegalensis]|uniref:Secreted protein n=1 Tax=Solea senegalensis TaxID=28829 RepID=A0AAV6SKZ3_SOLSE|nr:hypothetical protein JOB18_024745 [Solea senegalensis]
MTAPQCAAIFISEASRRAAVYFIFLSARAEQIGESESLRKLLPSVISICLRVKVLTRLSGFLHHNPTVSSSITSRSAQMGVTGGFFLPRHRKEFTELYPFFFLSPQTVVYVA